MAAHHARVLASLPPRGAKLLHFNIDIHGAWRSCRLTQAAHCQRIATQGRQMNNTKARKS